MPSLICHINICSGKHCNFSLQKQTLVKIKKLKKKTKGLWKISRMPCISLKFISWFSLGFLWLGDLKHKVLILYIQSTFLYRVSMLPEPFLIELKRNRQHGHYFPLLTVGGKYTWNGLKLSILIHIMPPLCHLSDRAFRWPTCSQIERTSWYALRSLASALSPICFTYSITISDTPKPQDPQARFRSLGVPFTMIL